MIRLIAMIAAAVAGATFATSCSWRGVDPLEAGWRDPPPEARPHVYWLWLNGYVDRDTAREELRAMKEAGFSGVLLFDMGARGDESARPPAGPAFLSPEWVGNLKFALDEAKRLGLQVDLSVASSWDMGGEWIPPELAVLGLYVSETTVRGGLALDLDLPFPTAPPSAPRGSDGKPAFWKDAAVLAVRDAPRAPGHDFVYRLDPPGEHELVEAVLDNGDPGDSAATAAMSPTRRFSLATATESSNAADFKEVLRGTLPPRSGARRFALPPGTRGRYVRLRLLESHDESRPRRSLGEFGLYNADGVNTVADHSAERARDGAVLMRSPAPLGAGPDWGVSNINDGAASGSRGVFASAGPPPLEISSVERLVDLTANIDSAGRLRWDAPEGEWTILRYVVMNSGERLKVPSPNSDGWAADHLNAEATKFHMEEVARRLRGGLGDLRESGLANLYLASYEVTGPVWSSGFPDRFRQLRGYDMRPYLPTLLGARVGDEETTERFLFDYRKTLGEELVRAYYAAARESARAVGLGVKSEAGGPGPPIHNVPVDSLLADAAVDEIQGEFWPFRPDADALWVVKETASAGHVYGKPIVHMEAFTSTRHWSEGPGDLKPSADRVFCEGGNHMVWHTSSHAPPEAGKPGWVYLAGTHLNRNVTWFDKARPFIDYLARASFLLQRGRFVGDVLYYYGDGGYKFVPPKSVKPGLGPGYDYDYVNSDVILHRLEVRDGRFTVPGGGPYSVLVLPDEEAADPDVLARVEELVRAGGVVIGPKPRRAHGLGDRSRRDARVHEIADRLWGDVESVASGERTNGAGRVVWGKTPRETLTEMGVGPDLVAPADIDFIHRRDGDADIYFLRNVRDRPITAASTFRIDGRAPEFWDPVTGEIQSAPEWRPTEDGRVEASINLAAQGSIFVVFRREGKPPEAPARRPGDLPEPLTIEGPWRVDFEGGPNGVVFPRLLSWTAHDDPAVKYFSGTGRYNATFQASAEWVRPEVGARVDLGGLSKIAEAWLNGRSLGVAWTRPYSLDAAGALREGENELVVEVVNTWRNRLIGDALLPPERRATRTNVVGEGGTTWAEMEPLESGLFGPVRVVADPR